MCLLCMDGMDRFTSAGRRLRICSYWHSSSTPMPCHTKRLFGSAERSWPSLVPPTAGFDAIPWWPTKQQEKARDRACRTG